MCTLVHSVQYGMSSFSAKNMCTAHLHSAHTIYRCIRSSRERFGFYAENQIIIGTVCSVDQQQQTPQAGNGWLVWSRFA